MAIEVWLQRRGELKMEEFDDLAEADAYLEANEGWGWQLHDADDDVDECTCGER